MFGSISSAAPNSTVTSSFTAVESCQVDVGVGLTVRVNGQVNATRPIALVQGNQIELDVQSPGPNDYKFVPWTYNGLQSYFAVATKQVGNRPTLKRPYRGQLWFEYQASTPTLFTKRSAGNEYQLDFVSNANGDQANDNIALIDYAGSYVCFYSETANTMRRRTLISGKPISLTRVWNGAVRTWETYALSGNGSIVRIAVDGSTTTSTATYTNAKCIFSDGTTLYVGGQGFINVMSDLNTVDRVITTTETIVYGAAIASTAMAVTRSGKILQVRDQQLVELYSSTMIGTPTVYKNQFVFPIIEEYKLRVLNADGSFALDISTGDRLPWGCSADRNNGMVVSHVDSKDIARYINLDGSAPSIYTFNYLVTNATILGATFFATHYLREFVLTTPPNPPVSGVSFPSWNAPIGVDVGSGEMVATTDGNDLIVAASPNATVLVNSEVKNILNTSNRVQVMLRSQEGRQSAAVVLGNYAFDFKVTAKPTTAFSTWLDVPSQFTASQLIYNVIVPAQVANAPVALSHGTMLRNGAAYDGSTPVNAGDRLKITINVPTGRTSYYSMLTIADSQFALIANTASTKIQDTQRYQEYLSTTTVSTFKVEDAGNYYLPNYSDVEVRKNGNLILFPTVLAANDVLVVKHTRMSAWWYDNRDTVLIGPNTNVVFRGITLVDDAPDNFDLGSVHLGIPDFDSQPDGQGTITGLSDQFSIQIYGDFMMISVNDAAPVAKPTVKNGDVIKVIYTVQNLWEDRYVKTTLYDGREYGFAVVHVDPALGQYPDPKTSANFMPSAWALVKPDNELPVNVPMIWNQNRSGEQGPALEVLYAFGPQDIPTIAVTPQWQTGATLLPTVANVPEWEMGIAQLKTPASIAEWEMGIAQIPTLMNSPGWEQSPTKAKAPRLIAGFNQYAPDLPFAVWDAKTHDPSTYFDYDIQENYIPSYGHEAIFRYFEAYWEPFQDITSRSVAVNWDNWNSVNNLTWQPGIYMFDQATYAPVNLIGQARVLNATVTFNPVWLYDSPQPEWVNDSSGVFAFLNWNHEESVPLKPVFVSGMKPLIYQNDPRFVADDKPLFNKNDPLYSQESTLGTNASTGEYASDKHWINKEPLKTGGYADATTAMAAGTSAAGNLIVTTYQQPEGTFSFIIKRETNLTCPIQTSDIIVGKWLIGGG